MTTFTLLPQQLSALKRVRAFFELASVTEQLPTSTTHLNNFAGHVEGGGGSVDSRNAAAGHLRGRHHVRGAVALYHVVESLWWFDTVIDIVSSGGKLA